MSSTVIRDFFVSLGFTTDNEGAKKMGDTLSSVTNKAGLLSKAFIALATGTVIAVAKTASGLDKLYYSSQRIGASAENIRAYGDAISQMGGDAQSALQSLESVAQKMRNSPGYEGMLSSLGVATRDSNGAMRDRVEVMKDLSKTFASMPSYQANAYANSLGIDEKTMLAMRDGKFLDNMQKYQKIRAQVGLNDDLAKSGSEFMTEFRDTAMMTKAITEVVIMTAGKALISLLKMINKFLQSAISWFNELNPNIKALIVAGLKIAMVTLIFGSFIAAISKIASILPLLKGLLFIIRAINLAFLASPIGIVLALAAAIALLYDDYKTWAEGGESLFDWGGFVDHLNSAKEYALKLGQQFLDLTSDYVHWSKLAEDGSSWLKLKGFINENGVSLKSLRDGFMNLHKDILNYALPTLKGYGSILSKILSGDFKGAFKEASEMVKNLGDRVTEAATNAWEFIKDVKNGDNTYFDASSIDLSGVTDRVKNTVETVTSSVVSVGKKVYQETKEGRFQALIDGMVSAGITDKKEQAMFLAQMDHESDGFGQLSENLNYSKKGLLKTFGKYYKSESLAGAEAKNPEKIANRIYGGRIGNNKEGDGYKYRGRGFIQLTGKSNYKAFADYSGIDIVSNPDLASRPDIAAQIATWYWNKNVKSKVSSGVKAVTKAINGGTNGLQDRIEKTEKYLDLVNKPSFIGSTVSKSTLNTKAPITKAPLLPANYSASNSKQNSVVVNQNYTSEMHINGADNPQMIANYIARKTENDLLRLSHNAKGVMG